MKLFAGVLTARLDMLAEARQMVEERFGPVDCASPVLDFDYTDYYERELGPGLKRCFWGFTRLLDPAALVDSKLFSNAVELRYSSGGKRLLNIDPGYITAASVVLASTKDFAHRLYLGKGIYGETTLLYRKKDYQALPWTYPDFRSQPYRQFFLELRAAYLAQLRLGDLGKVVVADMFRPGS